MKLDYVCRAPVYENSDARVVVYSGTVHQGTLQVAIKVQIHDSVEAANAVINEAMCQTRLSHKHICKVLDCVLEQTQDNLIKTVLILEWMTRDLATEITQRHSAFRYWSEPELLTYLAEIVSALLFAQSNGVSHRDIKPQNIFIDSENHLKLGDFGSSTSTMASFQLLGVQGTPLYLSPELKKWYRENPEGQVVPPIDPYQSDVFSLGITFLYMGRLEPPVELVLAGLEIDEVVERLIATIQGPTIQAVIRWMLAVDPINRPTFQSLSEYLSSLFPSDPASQPSPPAQVSVSIPAMSTTQCSMCQSVFLLQSQWQARDNGVYVCSQACLHQVTDYFCGRCKRPIQDSSWIPVYQSQFGEYAGGLNHFCSYQCAVQHFRIPAQPVQQRQTCVWCRDTVVVKELMDSTVIQLACLDVFHDMNCLMSYCSKQSKSFTEAVEFVCPGCRAPMTPDITDMVLKQRNLEVQNRNCEQCRTRPMVRGCDKGHRLCLKCCTKSWFLSFGSKEYCPICERTKNDVMHAVQAQEEQERYRNRG